MNKGICLLLAAREKEEEKKHVKAVDCQAPNIYTIIIWKPCQEQFNLENALC